MNKKIFIGATLVTVTAVGGLVYYRHRLLEQVDKWLDDGKQIADVFPEAMELTPEEADEFVESLKRKHP